GKGPVATILVRNGTVRVGDAVVVGAIAGRVRALIDENGRPVKEAGPSMPVQVLGLSEVPQAGDFLEVVSDERTAREIAASRQEQAKNDVQRAGRVRLAELFSRVQEGEVKDLNILVKADAQGSVEALRHSLEKLSTDQVRVNVIHGAAGGITESDVNLAAASNAIIIGFNVRPETSARNLAEREGVDIRLYRVIYDAIEEVQKAMEGLLEPKFQEVVLGRAEVRATFKVPGAGTVAGCYVVDGKVARNAQVRLLRDRGARNLAGREGVDTRRYRVLYDAIEGVQKAREGLLEPKFQEVVLGRAEVRATFKVPGVGTVAGCYVVDGKVARNAQVRLLRDNVVVYEGRIASLKRFKDDVREVQAGYECGIGIERFNDIKEGDVIEAFEMQQV